PRRGLCKRRTRQQHSRDCQNGKASNKQHEIAFRWRVANGFAARGDAQQGQDALSAQMPFRKRGDGPGACPSRPKRGLVQDSIALPRLPRMEYRRMTRLFPTAAVVLLLTGTAAAELPPEIWFSPCGDLEPTCNSPRVSQYPDLVPVNDI